jgi:hypothetical protein
LLVGGDRRLCGRNSKQNEHRRNDDEKREQQLVIHFNAPCLDLTLGSLGPGINYTRKDFPVGGRVEERPGWIKPKRELEIGCKSRQCAITLPLVALTDK